jgi:hypothetical protein
MEGCGSLRKAAEGCGSLWKVPTLHCACFIASTRISLTRNFLARLSQLEGIHGRKSLQIKPGFLEVCSHFPNLLLP